MQINSNPGDIEGDITRIGRIIRTDNVLKFSLEKETRRETGLPGVDEIHDGKSFGPEVKYKIMGDRMELTTTTPGPFDIPIISSSIFEKRN